MKRQIGMVLLLSFISVLGLVFFLKLRLEETPMDKRSRDTYESLSLEELKESLKSKKKRLYILGGKIVQPVWVLKNN